jgi:hypothetical protein
MDQLSRRSFIKGATAAVAAGGAVATIPLGTASASSAIADRTHKAMNLAADARLDESLVAHVKDLGSGEVSLYVGTRQVTVNDRHVAALLYAASREVR